MIDIKKLPTETEEEFLWKVGQMVDSGKIESWSSVNDIVNKELGIDEDKWRDESSFRKRYQAAKKFYNGCFSKMETAEYQEKLDELNRELARNTIKYRDYKNAWNKQNYADTRVNETMELIEEMIPTLGNANFEVHTTPSINGTTDLICFLSDLHIGQTFDSFWGSYNSDIAKQRLNDYLLEIIRIGKLHNSSKIHCVSIGDQISGFIHQTIQISNKENVIEQVKLAIEYISSFCYELSKYFKDVYFYDVPGNHSRLSPNKDNAVKDERLDLLIGWTVCQMLKHIDNFHDMTNRKFDSSIGEAHVRGKNYLLLHGDNDSITNAGIGKLVMMLGFCPEYILTGHRHTPAMSEINGITIYQSGSLPGSGDYHTVQHRLSGSASQTVVVCNEQGVECCYNVKLS